MSSWKVRVVGLTAALRGARLAAPEQEALRNELLQLAQVLQRIDLLLQGTRVRGELLLTGEDIVPPEVVPNALLPYLEVTAVQGDDEEAQAARDRTT